MKRSLGSDLDERLVELINLKRSPSSRINKLRKIGDAIRRVIQTPHDEFADILANSPGGQGTKVDLEFCGSIATGMALDETDLDATICSQDWSSIDDAYRTVVLQALNKELRNRYKEWVPQEDQSEYDTLREWENCSWWMWYADAASTPLLRVWLKSMSKDKAAVDLTCQSNGPAQARLTRCVHRSVPVKSLVQLVKLCIPNGVYLSSYAVQLWVWAYLRSRCETFFEEMQNILDEGPRADVERWLHKLEQMPCDHLKHHLFELFLGFCRWALGPIHYSRMALCFYHPSGAVNYEAEMYDASLKIYCPLSEYVLGTQSAHDLSAILCSFRLASERMHKCVTSMDMLDAEWAQMLDDVFLV